MCVLVLLLLLLFLLLLLSLLLHITLLWVILSHSPAFFVQGNLIHPYDTQSITRQPGALFLLMVITAAKYHTNYTK